MGDVEEEPLIKHADDRNDDDDGDTTGPPNGASSSEPGYPMATNLPPERGSTTAETSFTEGLPNVSGGWASTTDTAWGRLVKEFPNANEQNLKYKINNGRLEVDLIDPKKYIII